MIERKIDVSLVPHTWDNPKNPYFWCILKWSRNNGGAWVNDGCGWAKTPEEAFTAAFKYYNEYKAVTSEFGAS